MKNQHTELYYKRKGKTFAIIIPKSGVDFASNQSLWRHLRRDKEQLNWNYFISLGTFSLPTNINYNPTLIIPNVKGTVIPFIYH